jgi:serpin B
VTNGFNRKSVFQISVLALLLFLTLIRFPQTGLVVGDKPGVVSPVDGIAAGNNQFACELYRKIQLDPENNGKNIFLSPYSISTALAMTYAGSRGNTAEQMARTLHFAIPQADLHPAYAALNARIARTDSKTYQLNIANALWGQKGYHFEANFLDLIRRNYEGGFQTIDYHDPVSALKTINQWVERQTNSKIKDLLHLEDVDSLTRLVLTNAIYFKGDWELPFNPKQTQTASFIIAPGHKVDVPMMRQKGKFNYCRAVGVQILEMPYAGKDLAMLVMLPDGDINSFEAGLTADRIQEWRSQLKAQKVEVSLPKFKFLARYYLDQALPELGMSDAFSEADADFSGITGHKDLYIKHVIHQTMIDVNEQGSEAAAATAVVMDAKSVSRNPIFQADHPFMFAIIHQATGSLLFIGRVADPSRP